MDPYTEPSLLDYSEKALILSLAALVLAIVFFVFDKIKEARKKGGNT